jgi:serine phosphatase RsbU (regulator of sigma subunit)
MALTDSQQRIFELTTLNALAQTLNKAADIREAIEQALQQIIELMGLNSGWVFMLEENGHFRLAARHDLPPAISYPGPAWQGSCDCQEFCLSGKLNKAVNMVRCTRLRNAIGDKRGLFQHASVPLLSGDQVLGILNVATSEWARFSPAQLQLLSAAGFLLGTAIARAQLYEQVKVRRVQEQGALLRLSQELMLAEALDPALQRLVRVGARMLQADACAYIEADEEAGQAILRATHGWDLPENMAWPVVLDHYQPHLWYLPERSTNLADDTFEALPDLLARQGFAGHMCVTVQVGNAPVGTLIVNAHSARSFLDDEVQTLELLASLLAQTIERDRLQQESLGRQKLEQELDLARDIQASFLPNTRPDIPGYQIDAFYLPARQVGGDFYDFIPFYDSDQEQLVPRDLPLIATIKGRPQQKAPTPKQLGIVIADVTDKGVPAALFMVLSRTLLRANASGGRTPVAVMKDTNRLILDESRAGLFVTCFYALLDTETHRLSYADAGHNYPLLYRAETETIEELYTKGIVLGIMPEAQFDQRSLDLQQGDLVCFYTDGVTESMNAERDMFGEERLKAILRQYHASSPAQIIEQILSALRTFVGDQAQHDDITIVIVKRNP